MSREIEESDEKADVVGAYLEELEAAADPEAVVRRYVQTHPQWANDFIEEAVFSRMLVTSRAETIFPDLQKLTDFRIIRWVAAGGMGVVYEAEQISLKRRVALKVRYGQLSPEREARFRGEQRALARLHQSHIVPIHLAGQCGFWQYFVMAYIEGATLHQVVKAAIEQISAGRSLPSLADLVRVALLQQSRLSESSRLAEFAADLVSHTTEVDQSPRQPRQSRVGSSAATLSRPIALPPAYFRSVAALMADAAEAIEHAHAAAVIHRDIKPSNIMVDVAAHCWLIDFGLAHFTRGSKPHAAIQDHSTVPRTQTGVAVGTPGYMAPEQIPDETLPEGKKTIDRRSDVWGLGVTLFELVVLQRPFQGATPEELRENVLAQSPPPLQLLVRNVPADLAAICQKALHKDPASRYQRAADLAADLRRWQAGLPTVARPARLVRAVWLWTRRNKGWAAALVSSLLGVLAAAIFVIFYTRAEAHQADLRAESAEERVRQEQSRLRLQEREAMLQEIQRLRLADLNNGWSSRAWRLIGPASEIKADDRLRDLAVGTLLGLDASLAKQFPIGASSVAWDAGEKRLLLGGLDGPDGRSINAARVWQVGSEQGVESSVWGEGPVGFSAAGTPLQLVFQRPHLVLWDVESQRPIQRFLVPGIDAVESTNQLVLALGPQGTLVAASLRSRAGTGRTTIWETASGKVAFEFEAADEMSFSDHDNLLALVDFQQHQIIVRSLDAKDILATLPTGNLPIRSLAFGKSRRRSVNSNSKQRIGYLAAGDSGGSITIWDLATKMPISFCRGLPRDVFALAFNPDGTLLASGGREEAQIWEVANGRHRLRLRPDNGIDFITQVAFSPSGRQLAVSSRGLFYAPSVTVWDLMPNRGLQRLLGLSSQIETVALSPDSKSIAVLAQNWEIGLWDLKSGRLRMIIEAPPGAYADNAALAFSPDSRQLAFAVSGLTAGAVRIWNATTGDEIERWQLPPGLQNHFGFDGPDHLWHFQVEIADGSNLPLSNFSWQQHPRVCRIRDLKAANATRIVAEIRDFNRYVFKALATPDGKHFIVEGRGGNAGEHRWVKILESSNGRTTWSHETGRTEKSAGLIMDPLGKVLFFKPADDERSTIVSIPDGKTLAELNDTPFATSVNPSLTCRHVFGDATGCFLFRDGDARPIVNLALDAAITGAVFDRHEARLIWCGRDGSVVVCDLVEIQKRLQEVGLSWRSRSSCE